MNMLALQLQTALALGALNVFRVCGYRFKVRFGLLSMPVRSFSLPVGPFFGTNDCHATALPCPFDLACCDQMLYFGWQPVPVGRRPPQWNVDPASGRQIDSTRAWWKIVDFGADQADIKWVWEASRFGWLMGLAQLAKANDTQALDRMNTWLRDWCEKNPPYLGPNWKCGQEAAIRVMHLAMAALLLKQQNHPTNAITAFLRTHLTRIEQTRSYALAQDNNHGISEAAALFIGGTWLKCAATDMAADRWATLGRKSLEERVARLVAHDGSFSQHSTNYHRVLLDTLCMVELWRQRIGEKPFTPLYLSRARAATSWMYVFTEPVSGDAPNLGANDGARLLPLTDTDYRDFRPSVQMASVLFDKSVAYPDIGPWDTPLCWMDIERPVRIRPAKRSCLFDKGGYAYLCQGRAQAYLRFPRYRFRPGQADALHLDFWIGSLNVLRDAGSYSYHSSPWCMQYFPGTRAHNTVEFDDRDQMPRISRFLYGRWLKSEACDPIREAQPGILAFEAAYTDWRKARHQRQVRLAQGRLTIVDQLAGNFNKATLRWRLAPGEWQLEGNALRGENMELFIQTTASAVRVRIIDGWESRYYGLRTTLPVLEVEVTEPCSVITNCTWKP